jgi:hypothetical protein
MGWTAEESQKEKALRFQIHNSRTLQFDGHWVLISRG